MLRSTSVRVGAPECMVPPNPVIWGAVPPGSAAYAPASIESGQRAATALTDLLTERIY